MRKVTASISVGPPPVTARSRAAATTEIMARASLPSTRTPGMPKAADLTAKLVAAVWACSGVEIAQPLLTQRNSTGAPSTPAKFPAS
jgi:hypothetical protein